MWTRLNNLKPNSQHVVYVMAIGLQGMSLPSETLVAWTDPALPAFVDVSIHEHVPYRDPENVSVSPTENIKSVGT